MTYEDKRHSLIKTIKIITLVVFGVGAIAVGVVAYVVAGQERRSQCRLQLRNYLLKLKEGFERFSRRTDDR